MGFAMGYLEGDDRHQRCLLPPAVDEYVGCDAPVRVVDAFVDALDFRILGFNRAAPASTGRPGYNPRDLLKLYIYGYLNEVRSSRRLERECRRNVEVMWLVRRLAPDHKTIADFRRDNGAAIVGACRAFVLFCRDAGLFAARLVSMTVQNFARLQARTGFSTNVGSLKRSIRSTLVSRNIWPNLMKETLPTRVMEMDRSRMRLQH
jgi:transposase